MDELEFGDALGEVGDYVGFSGVGNGGGSGWLGRAGWCGDRYEDAGADCGGHLCGDLFGHGLEFYRAG